MNICHSILLLCFLYIFHKFSTVTSTFFQPLGQRSNCRHHLAVSKRFLWSVSSTLISHFQHVRLPSPFFFSSFLQLPTYKQQPQSSVASSLRANSPRGIHHHHYHHHHQLFPSLTSTTCGTCSCKDGGVIKRCTPGNQCAANTNSRQAAGKGLWAAWVPHQAPLSSPVELNQTSAHRLCRAVCERDASVWRRQAGVQH